jgi:hypothetical protein
MLARSLNMLFPFLLRVASVRKTSSNSCNVGLLCADTLANCAFSRLPVTGLALARNDVTAAFSPH